MSNKVTFSMQIDLPETDIEEARQIIQQALYYARENVQLGIDNQTIFDPENWKVGSWQITTFSPAMSKVLQKQSDDKNKT